MPLKKKPESLLNLCQLSINVHIIKLITFIQNRHGFGSLTSNAKLKLVQDHLKKNLFPSMIDNLLKTVDPLQNLTESTKLMLLKIYMHDDMINFQPSFRLPSKDSFYELQLIDLKKLVVLNLRMVCTDEILEVVGKYCPLLEIVDIVSKIGSESNKTKNQLNALKLKFYVSDDGLRHLHKCVRLRKIIMNAVIRSNCGGRKITHDGIRQLLKTLPKLQNICYSDMGFVLKDYHEDNQLNLKQLHDNHTNPEHIDIFSKLCPQLKCLCLCIPTTNNDDSMPHICMDHLAKSELKLNSLALGMFPVGENFISYLSLKGNHLTSLSLIHRSTINLHIIQSVARCCPNLKVLEVYRLLPKMSPYETTSEENNKQVFKNLESLKIIGTCWDPSIVLPLCVFESPLLQELLLVNEHYYKPVDDVINFMIKNNRLNYLKEISLLDGFSMNVETLIKLVVHCTQLKHIRLKKGTNFEEYLNVIKEENNLDLSISTDSLRNFGECLC